MKDNLNKILSFHCPRWDELPEKAILNSELVEYICRVLDPIMNGKKAITQTMIQNYSKWGIIPKLKGRKYEKKHISILIVVCIYKQVININKLEEGLNTKLKEYSLAEGYNYFAEIFEGILKGIFYHVVENGKLYLEEYEAEEGLEGLVALSNSFVLKLLSEMIIESGGFENLRSENE